MTVSFDVPRKVFGAISKVLARIADDAELTQGAETMYGDQWQVNMEMDMVACHANGCPIDWERLLEEDDATFGHDVFGITRYIDHDTGELTQCFVPRCAL